MDVLLKVAVGAIAGTVVLVGALAALDHSTTPDQGIKRKEQCAVCNNTLSDDKVPAKCGKHFIHKKCKDEILKDQSVCPYCRKGS